MASAAPATEDLSGHIKTTALLTSAMGPFDDAQRDVLPVGSSTEVLLEDRVSLYWMRNARGLTEFHVARIKKVYSSISAFLQAAMIPTDYRAYVFLSVSDDQTLRRIAWCSLAYSYFLRSLPGLTIQLRAQACYSVRKIAVSACHSVFPRIKR